MACSSKTTAMVTNSINSIWREFEWNVVVKKALPPNVTQLNSCFESANSET